MDKSFAHYYSPTEDEFKTIWKGCIFIFDTNVLLNIYEYSEDNRKIFFDVLEALKKRIWIPYHVGLEFHRNRFSRIRNAEATLNNLKNGINAALTALSETCATPISQLTKKKINTKEISKRIDAIQKAGESLIGSIDAAKDSLPRASMSDEIGKKVSELFTGKVGERPATQDDLQTLISDADERTTNNIPPGFEDKGKGDATFLDHGIRYSNKHGDLIIWKQIIAHAKKDSSKSIVFVTGDSKSDWWLREGPLTLGPRIELTQEIIAEAGIPRFWMYNVDRFLEYARDALNIKEVTDSIIKESKYISQQQHSARERILLSKNDAKDIQKSMLKKDSGVFSDFSNYIRHQLSATPTDHPIMAFEKWLNANYIILQNRSHEFDYIALDGNTILGFDVRTIGNAIVLNFFLRNIFGERHRTMLYNNQQSKISPSLVIISADSEVKKLLATVENTLDTMNQETRSAYTNIIIGTVTNDENFRVHFTLETT